MKRLTEEQLNELSKRLVANYMQRSVKDLASQKNDKKKKNRLKGFETADKKLQESDDKKNETAVNRYKHSYSKTAVNKAIESSNRSGRKISGREARLIHRLLSGGRKSIDETTSPKERQIEEAVSSFIKFMAEQRRPAGRPSAPSRPGGRGQYAVPSDWIVRDTGRCADPHGHSGSGNYGRCVAGVDPDPHVRSEIDRDRDRGDGGDDPH